MTNVLIVSRSYPSSEKLAAALRERGLTATCVYRDYHFNRSLKGIDVVVTDGTCKTRDSQGVSHSIRFNEPSTAAKRKHVPLVEHDPYGDVLDDAGIAQRVDEVLAATSR